MEKVILNSIFFCSIGSKNCDTTKEHTISLKSPRGGEGRETI